MVRLSKKHGVNPTIPMCFWCGESKNEVVLLGKLKGDVQAPIHMVMDYEPCEACAKIFKDVVDGGGVVLMEAQYTPLTSSQQSISKDKEQNPIFPTGRYIGIKRDGLLAMFNGEFDPKQHEKMLVDAPLFKTISDAYGLELRTELNDATRRH